jgi:hypothetical protein
MQCNKLSNRPEYPFCPILEIIRIRIDMANRTIIGQAFARKRSIPRDIHPYAMLDSK